MSTPATATFRRTTAPVVTRLHVRAAVLLALGASLAAPAAARGGEAVQPLVARVLAAYGGKAALERAQVIREEGTVTSPMHPGAGRMVRVLRRPASLRVEIAYPGSPPEVRVVHGGRGDRDGVEVTGTPAHAAMVLQAARLALPLLLAEPGVKVTDRGELERDGRKLRALALALPGGLEVVAEIDPHSGRILRSVGAIPVPGGPGRIEFATAYSQFKRVGGVLFAFHEENWARGRRTGETSLEKIELLREAPPGAFDERL